MRGKTKKRLRKLFLESTPNMTWRSFKRKFLSVPSPMRFDILNINKEEE